LARREHPVIAAHHVVRIVEDKDTHQAIVGKRTEDGGIRSEIRNWRAAVDEDGQYSFAIAL
jgi:hypothetical protein